MDRLSLLHNFVFMFFISSKCPMCVCVITQLTSAQNSFLWLFIFAISNKQFYFLDDFCSKWRVCVCARAHFSYLKVVSYHSSASYIFLSGFVVICTFSSMLLAHFTGDLWFLICVSEWWGAWKAAATEQSWRLNRTGRKCLSEALHRWAEHIKASCQQCLGRKESSREPCRY